MQASTVPPVGDVVLVGGGHAHVQVLAAFRMERWAGIRVTLVNENALTPYSGMLPGHIAGIYTADEMMIDLRRLAVACGARFIEARVTGVDRAARTVQIADRPPLGYELLSINTGIDPDPGQIADPLGRLLPVKPIAALMRPDGALARVLADRGAVRLVIIGAGAAGIELSFALRARRPDAAVALIAAGEVGAAFSGPTRRLIRRRLVEAGVTLHEGAPAIAVDALGVRMADGRHVPAGVPILATGARPAPWLVASDLPKAPDGFLAIGDTLALVDDDRVFAAGDCATLISAPRPKAGVYAVRQGPVLAENLARRLRGERLRPYRAQVGALALLLTGRTTAVAARGWLPPVEGRAVFRLKDRIDRAFMSRFKDLYERPDLLGQDDDTAMRCLGCAAKVGPAALGQALAQLPPPIASLAAGIETAEDGAVVRQPDGRVSIETVDLFPAPVDDPFLAGRIAALHAVSDVIAMGGRPVRALAIAMLPPAAPAVQARDLAQMLAGARAALDPLGCVLAGGHSAEGPMGIGFAITGEATDGEFIVSTGGRPGDALILSGALGTGLVLAAMMRGQAGPEAVDAMLAPMLRGQDDALHVLRAHGVRGLTDVTGFGLVGHLRTMLRAGQGASIHLGSIPVLPAARHFAALGLRSSAVAGNRAALAGAILSGPLDPATEAVLCDPQTCGPLLAAIPADHALAAVSALRTAGQGDAAVIGRLTDDARLVLHAGPQLPA